MIEPSFQSFSRIARPGAIVPVVKRISADLLTPVSAYLRLARAGQASFLLESVEGGEKIARYSFMGVGPEREFRYRDGVAEVRTGKRVERRSAGLFGELRKLTRADRPVSWPGLPPFTSGAVGYFSYDVARLLERLPAGAVDDLRLPEAHLLFFSRLLVFDHLRHEVLLIANVRAQGRPGLRRQYSRAVETVKEMEERLRQPLRATMRPHSRRPYRAKLKTNMHREDYLAAVRQAKGYIRAGDIYQVVLSQRFQRRVSTDAFSIYRALRRVNPSPYMYFLALDGLEVVGASPEMLVKVQGRDISYRPIAGTRPRGKTEEEDRRLEQQLRQSAKERAEHVMLVDLGRNDVGRVSETGSVRVESLQFVERYSHVMHLVSSLHGRLRRNLDCFDALSACFPAGTVTGAPKVRAMEIIDELEPTRRGLYAGAVCYLDFSGSLDSCIAIRTIVLKDGVAYVQAGAGIVADSNPEREYEETLSKARALLEAIEWAEQAWL